MFELPSARTFIAGGNEFLFARFYDVYEGMQLVQLENPPIVSGVPDMHPSDSQNVEETRNLMQTFSRKKCTHFFQRMFHLHFQRNRKMWSFILVHLFRRQLSAWSGSLPSIFHHRDDILPYVRCRHPWPAALRVYRSPCTRCSGCGTYILQAD